MFRVTTIFILTLLFVLAACSPPRKIYLFDEPVPPRILIPEASQSFLDHPPLYTPKGNRETIFVYSPHFTLAIPNAMDITGRSDNLQRSLADMLYTEIFSFQSGRQIDLLDRGALVHLDQKYVMLSLYPSGPDSPAPPKKTAAKKQQDKTGDTLPAPSIPEWVKEYRQLKIDTEELKEYLKRADGILLTYITSRVGKQNGYFEVDYRIVINKGWQKKSVLMAGSEKIRYHSNSAREVEYTRKDVAKIAAKIYSAMSPMVGGELKMEAQIIKYDYTKDHAFIVINMGKEHNLIPGMIGYVVELDESLNNEGKSIDGKMDDHHSYIAEFIITNVSKKTSNAVIIKPKFDWDIKVDDVVVIK